MFTLRRARTNLWPGGDPPLSPACSPSCCANTLCVLELGDRWKLDQKKNIFFLSGSCLAFDAGMHTNRYSWGGSRMQRRDGYEQHKLELGTDRYSKRTRDQHHARNLCLHTWLHSPHPNPCRKNGKGEGEVRVETLGLSYSPPCWRRNTEEAGWFFRNHFWWQRSDGAVGLCSLHCAGAALCAVV